MIQFNLLPDVKQQYIRSQRLKRTLVSVSVVVGGASLTILILLFLVVNVAQKQHLSGLDSDIKDSTSQLNSITDLAKVLTIQNQLNSLPALHDAKPVTTRLFGYLKQLVPDKISISELKVDFDAQTFTFTGTSESLSIVNKFVDTLKFTTYTTGAIKGEWANGNEYKTNDLVSHNNTSYVATDDHKADPNNQPGVGNDWRSHWKQAPSAFSGVVLTAFSRDDKEAKYTIDLTYTPEIFDSSVQPSLYVPKIVTSRSETEKPSALFKKPAKTEDTTNIEGLINP